MWTEWGGSHARAEISGLSNWVNRDAINGNIDSRRSSQLQAEEEGVRRGGSCVVQPGIWRAAWDT